MPNHVTNRLRISGTTEQIAAFRAAFIVMEQDEEGQIGETFDFERIIPMPPILRETESGSNANWALIVKGVDVPGFNSVTKAEAMLIWPWVKEAGVTSVEELKSFLREHAQPVDLDALGDKLLHVKAETGHYDWYDWSIENWGTKWNAYFFMIQSEEPTYLEFTFATAWSVPDPVYATLADRPEVEGLMIEIMAFDEGWNFAFEGSIEDGIYNGEYVEATDDLYEEVYGERPIHDDEEENEKG